MSQVWLSSFWKDSYPFETFKTLKGFWPPYSSKLFPQTHIWQFQVKPLRLPGTVELSICEWIKPVLSGSKAVEISVRNYSPPRRNRVSRPGWKMLLREPKQKAVEIIRCKCYRCPVQELQEESRLFLAHVQWTSGAQAIHKDFQSVNSHQHPWCPAAVGVSDSLSA